MATPPTAPRAAPSTAAPGDAGPPTTPLGSRMLDMLGPTFTETTWTGWLVLLAGIFGGLVAGKIAQSTLRGIGRRFEERGWPVRATIFNSAASPASLALFASGLGVGLHRVFLSEKVSDLPLKVIALFDIIALGWFIYNLISLIDFALRKLTARSATKLDDTVVTLVRKALRIFLMVMFVLFVAENIFGADITAWLAGLGIAGLAVSLAAQDSIKNIFGSVTVLLERPFGLGDRIIFGGYDGIVENISFRSTKIRTLGGHLVTVPNMKFTDGTIENITARPYIQRTIDLNLTYGMSAEQIDRAVEIVRGVLAEPEVADSINVPDLPPRVHFNKLNADSLNIAVIYWYALNTAGRDWWSFQDHSQDVNMRILRVLNEAGIELAYPTQTIHLAENSDSERPSKSISKSPGGLDV